jgi:hypothetical protein
MDAGRVDAQNAAAILHTRLRARTRRAAQNLAWRRFVLEFDAIWQHARRALGSAASHRPGFRRGYRKLQTLNQLPDFAGTTGCVPHPNRTSRIAAGGFSEAQ